MKQEGAELEGLTHDEDALDEAIEESFPASDPPGNTVELGIAIAPPPEPDDQPADDSDHNS
jgi:hypothetical protein